MIRMSTNYILIIASIWIDPMSSSISYYSLF